MIEKVYYTVVRGLAVGISYVPTYLDEGELFLGLAQLFPKSGGDLIQQANGQSSPLHDNLNIAFSLHFRGGGRRVRTTSS